MGLRFMALAILLSSLSTHAYLPNIPMHAARLNGYVLHSRPSATNKLDVFLGPFCEDSRRAFSSLKSLSMKEKRIEVRAHLFPLPYNTGSFFAAQTCVAAGVVSSNKSVVPRCLELLYTGETQKKLKTNALENYTSPELIQELVELISSSLSLDKNALSQQMVQGLEGGASSYTLTKSDYKYGTSMGVFSTPSVFLNGVQIFGYDAQGAKKGTDHAEGQLASMACQDWERFLAPVLESRFEV